jgi:DNA polymerase III delta prime subunit
MKLSSPKHHAVLLTSARFGPQGGLSAQSFCDLSESWAGITLRRLDCFDNEEDFWLEASHHPDIWVAVRDKNQLNLDDLEGLKERGLYAPQLGNRRVFLIDGAHRLNHNAANSLLKTLEEPSVPSLFILTARSKNSVLSTLTSRCQNLDFSAFGGPVANGLLLEVEYAKKLSIILERSTRYLRDSKIPLKNLGNLIQEADTLAQNCSARNLLDHLASAFAAQVISKKWNIQDLRQASADLRAWDKAIEWNASSSLWLTRILISASG